MAADPVGGVRRSHAMSADKHAKCLFRIVVLAAASIVLLHAWVVARSSGARRRAKPLLSVRRDLMPPMELPLNHSLRQTVLWRDDGRLSRNP